MRGSEVVDDSYPIKAKRAMEKQNIYVEIQSAIPSSFFWIVSTFPL